MARMQVTTGGRLAELVWTELVNHEETQKAIQALVDDIPMPEETEYPATFRAIGNTLWERYGASPGGTDIQGRLWGVLMGHTDWMAVGEMAWEYFEEN